MLVSMRRFSSDFSHHRDRFRLVAAVGWSFMFDPSVLQEQFKFQHWLLRELSTHPTLCKSANCYMSDGMVHPQISRSLFKTVVNTSKQMRPPARCSVSATRFVSQPRIMDDHSCAWLQGCYGVLPNSTYFTIYQEKQPTADSSFVLQRLANTSCAS
jgi:hypothetical protein